MFTYPLPRGRHDHTDQGFAVIDLETTGFDARGRDRVVEIGIVRSDALGRELGRFETLVDPGRAVTASAVHRIDAAMLHDAPTFAEIAPSVLAWLEGAVIVAHNAPFEDAFLSAEFARAGWTLPPMPALDTLPLAQQCVPTANHRLVTVCDWAGVPIRRAHTAMGDAQATARILPLLLRRSARRHRWRDPLPRLGGRLQGRYRPRGLLAPA